MRALRSLLAVVLFNVSARDIIYIPNIYMYIYGNFLSEHFEIRGLFCNVAADL
jgi:hypothetical protein